MSGAITVKRLTRLDSPQQEALARVLVDCVEGGASVGFLAPLSLEKAFAFFSRVAQGVEKGERAILAAIDSHGICGTVQLLWDLPENQPHRADLAKLLVHRRARGQGIATALLNQAEAVARAQGKTLLVLDTVTESDAHRLYARLGWTAVGNIPDYALMPDGSPCSTTYFFKNLDPQPSADRVASH